MGEPNLRSQPSGVSQPPPMFYSSWFMSFTLIFLHFVRVLDHHPKGSTDFFNGGNDFQGPLWCFLGCADDVTLLSLDTGVSFE